MNSQAQQRRALFRVVYPEGVRPTLAIRGRRYEVVDLSETGVRFLATDANAPQLGQTLRASVTFNDGTSLDVEGETFRALGNEVVLRLSKQIGYSRIIREQIELIRRFKRYR